MATGLLLLAALNLSTLSVVHTVLSAWPDPEASYAHCELVPGTESTLAGQFEFRTVLDSGMLEVKVNVTGPEVVEGWYANGISIRQFGDTSQNCANMGEPWYMETPAQISDMSWEDGKLFEDTDGNMLFVFPDDFNVLGGSGNIIGRGLMIIDDSPVGKPLGCCTIAEADGGHWHDSSKSLVRTVASHNNP